MSLQRRINRSPAAKSLAALNRLASKAADPRDRFMGPDWDLTWPQPNKPDKGQKDGSCNRTACQRPLAGRPQFFMRGNLTGGPRLYYCEHCRIQFDEADFRTRPGQPKRCEPDEGNATLAGEN